MSGIRPAAVAGMFYPESAQELRATVDEMLLEAKASTWKKPPKALVVPHAGYVYSGPIAATAYAALKPFADQIHKVILLGPAHRVMVHGLAYPAHDRFQTPLGEIEIDPDLVRRIQDLPGVSQNERAHALEHSLEVQLPFLQTVLSNFKILPLVLGQASPKQIHEILKTLWGGTETIFIISSDLSHYLPYDLAKNTDQQTIQSILALEGLDHDQACGATPINGLLYTARQKKLHPELLDLRNSGDTVGDQDRVVGYSSFAFFEE